MSAGERRARRVPSGPPRRLYALSYGHEPIPESVSLAGGRDDVFLLEPVTGAAVAYDDGWVLLDTGLNPGTIRDPERRAAHYPHVAPSYVGIVPPGDPLADQVAATGLAWSDLAFAAVSHLHCDHSGGLPRLVDGPAVVLQEREHAFAFDEAGLSHAYFRSDYDLPGLAFDLVDGETELAPGLRALPTFGHTPGHMSFAVDLAAEGTVVLACDAADLARNVTEAIPPGTTTHPELARAAADSIALLHRLSREIGTQVWPGHDPAFWPTRRRPPGAYV